MFLLGIDYGTGGAKATIVDTQGVVRGYAFEEYPILTPHPGWSEHNPQLYWEIARRIIRTAIGEANVESREIRGIATFSSSR